MLMRNRGGVVDWIHLPQDRDQGLTLVNHLLGYSMQSYRSITVILRNILLIFKPEE
jgi:hypothetical protein